MDKVRSLKILKHLKTTGTNGTLIDDTDDFTERSKRQCVIQTRRIAVPNLSEAEEDELLPKPDHQADGCCSRGEGKLDVLQCLACQKTMNCYQNPTTKPTVVVRGEEAM